MKMQDFMKSWEGMNWEVVKQRIINGILALTVLILVVINMNKEEKIILKPVTLGSDAWLTQDKASQSYKEAWALWMAQFQGNVNPRNVDFIKERIEPLLSLRIRSKVITAFDQQSQAMKTDGVQMRFEPKEVLHEDSTGMVFVTGTGFSSGQLDEEDSYQRTYAYRIAIQNFGPQFTHIETYKGKPKTQERLEQLQRESERRKERLKNAEG